MKKNIFKTAIAVLSIVSLLCSIVPLSAFAATTEPTWSIIQGPNDNISNQIINDKGTVDDPDDYKTWSFPGWAKPSIISTTEDGTLMSVVKEDINHVAKIPNQNYDGSQYGTALFEFDFTLYADAGDYTQSDKPLALALSPYGMASASGEWAHTKMVSKSQGGVGFKIYQNGKLELYKPDDNGNWGTAIKSISDFALDKKHHFVIGRIAENTDSTWKMAVYIDGELLHSYDVSANSLSGFGIQPKDVNIGVSLNGGWNLQDAKVLIDLTPTTTKQELATLAKEYTTYMNNTVASDEAKATFKTAIDAAKSASTYIWGKVDYVATLNALKTAKSEYDKNVTEISNWQIVQGPNDNISNQIKNDGGTATDPDDYTTWSFLGWVKPSIISTTEDGTLMSVVKDDINNVSTIPNQNGNNAALYEFDFTLYKDSGDYTQGNKALVLAVSPWGIANATNGTKIVSNSAFGVGFKIYQDGILKLYTPTYSWGTEVATITNFALDVKHHFVIAQVGWADEEFTIRKMAVYLDGEKLYEWTVSAADKDNTDKSLARQNLNIGVAMTEGWNLQDAKVLIDLTPTTTKQELATLATEYTSYMNSTLATADAKAAFGNAITDAIEASNNVDGGADHVATLNALKDAKVAYEDEVLILGDADCNGTVDSSDLVKLRGILLGAEYDKRQEVTVNVHTDDSINIKDLVGLKKLLVNKV